MLDRDDDPPYEPTTFRSYHRITSETLAQAVRATDTEKIASLLREAAGYGMRAMKGATNSRERLLALGMLHTIDTLVIFIESGYSDEQES